MYHCWAFWYVIPSNERLPNITTSTLCHQNLWLSNSIKSITNEKKKNSTFRRSDMDRKALYIPLCYNCHETQLQHHTQRPILQFLTKNKYPNGTVRATSHTMRNWNSLKNASVRSKKLPVLMDIRQKPARNEWKANIYWRFGVAPRRSSRLRYDHDMHARARFAPKVFLSILSARDCVRARLTLRVYCSFGWQIRTRTVLLWRYQFYLYSISKQDPHEMRTAFVRCWFASVLLLLCELYMFVYNMCMLCTMLAAHWRYLLLFGMCNYVCVYSGVYDVYMEKVLALLDYI